MNNISSSLQKIIQENLSRLNMDNNAQVFCSCSLTGIPVNVAQDTTTPAPIANEPVVAAVTVKPDFIPGGPSSQNFGVADVGNVPFILPEGVTPEGILREQAAALAPMVKAAEEATGATALPATTVVTTETPSAVVSVETPAAPATTLVQTTTPSSTMQVEKFAPVSTHLSSYRDIESPHAQDFSCAYARPFPRNPNLHHGSHYAAYYGSYEQQGSYAPPYGKQDYIVQIASPPECNGFFSFSWLLYIICVAVFLYVVVTQFNLI